MGCGSWTKDSYVSYSTTKGMSVSTDGTIRGSYSNQDMFKATLISLRMTMQHFLQKHMVRRLSNGQTLLILSQQDLSSQHPQQQQSQQKILQQSRKRLFLFAPSLEEQRTKLL